MRTKTVLTALLLPLSLFISGGSTTTPPAPDSLLSAAIPDPCETDNISFQDGEKIVYKLFYNWNFVWLSAGEVAFTVHDTGNEYHVAV